MGRLGEEGPPVPAAEARRSFAVALAPSQDRSQVGEVGGRRVEERSAAPAGEQSCGLLLRAPSLISSSARSATHARLLRWRQVGGALLYRIRRGEAARFSAFLTPPSRVAPEGGRRAATICRELNRGASLSPLSEVWGGGKYGGGEPARGAAFEHLEAQSVEQRSED